MFAEFTPEFFSVLAALTKLVILAMLLERGLVLIFDYRWFKARLDGYGFKVPISFLTSWAICGYYNFDVLSALFEPDKPTSMGIFLTAAIVAGGSAGAITLFQGVLKFNKQAQDDLQETRKAEAQARRLEAEAKKHEAAARKKAAEAQTAEAEQRMQNVQ